MYHWRTFAGDRRSCYISIHLIDPSVSCLCRDDHDHVVEFFERLENDGWVPCRCFWWLLRLPEGIFIFFAEWKERSDEGWSVHINQTGRSSFSCRWLDDEKNGSNKNNSVLFKKVLKLHFNLIQRTSQNMWNDEDGQLVFQTLESEWESNDSVMQWGV